MRRLLLFLGAFLLGASLAHLIAEARRAPALLDRARRAEWQRDELLRAALRREQQVFLARLRAETAPEPTPQPEQTWTANKLLQEVGLKPRKA